MLTRALAATRFAEGRLQFEVFPMQTEEHGIRMVEEVQEGDGSLKDRTKAIYLRMGHDAATLDVTTKCTSVTTHFALPHFIA